MSKITKRTLNAALDAAMNVTVESDRVKAQHIVKHDGLAKTIRSAWTQSGGRKLLADWLFDMADNVEAVAGNPFHKARQTCNTRCRISVKVIEEEGEIIDIALKPMATRTPGTTKGGKVKAIDPDKAYDSLVKWMTTKSKANPEFAKALLSFNANALRKAVNDGARDAGIR